MRRLHIFIIIFAVALASVVALAVVSWYFAVTAPTYYGSSWMGQMWGSHMGSGSSYGMGGMMGGGIAASSVSYLWLIPVALGVVVAVAVIGVAFYLAFPEIKYIRGTCNPSTPSQTLGTSLASAANSTGKTAGASVNAPKVSSSCQVLLKTLTPDEKKVMDVLVAHQGKYLQKYVVKESGLSRLKTHRIIARFAERGIVTVKEFGNTNEVVLSDWVRS